MPYCPKCDMEFVDGITVCSDCGGPLISTEEYEAFKQEEVEAFVPLDAVLEAEEELSEKPVKSCSSHAYVSKRQRYEDMRSSVLAFLLVGCLFLVFSVLLWIGVVKLPVNEGSGLLFRCVLTALALAFLAVAAVTRRSASAMKTSAEEEQSRTQELIDWFVAEHTKEGLDQLLKSESPLPEGNELVLKRFELIQDRLVTSRDLPDPDYVDFLCEEIYGKIYEK